MLKLMDWVCVFQGNIRELLVAYFLMKCSERPGLPRLAIENTQLSNLREIILI